jgi:PIF1-like helicase
MKLSLQYLFKFPVVDDENDDGELPECQLAKNPERLNLLKATKIIFWDEFVSNHREILESVVEFLPDVIFILAGDFRQILPVIERGTIHDIIAATIISSRLWPRFETLALIKNMRLINSTDTDNISYSEALLAIGEGRSHPDAFILHQCNNESVIALPKMEVFTERQKAIDWLYPEGQPLGTDRGMH